MAAQQKQNTSLRPSALDFDEDDEEKVDLNIDLYKQPEAKVERLSTQELLDIDHKVHVDQMRQEMREAELLEASRIQQQEAMFMNQNIKKPVIQSRLEDEPTEQQHSGIYRRRDIVE